MVFRQKTYAKVTQKFFRIQHFCVKRILSDGPQQYENNFFYGIQAEFQLETKQLVCFYSEQRNHRFLNSGKLSKILPE